MILHSSAIATTPNFWYLGMTNTIYNHALNIPGLKWHNLLIFIDTLRTAFKNREKANDTTLSKYVWEVKDKYKETLSLKWSIVKSVPGYSNITKKCLLCLYEKLEIINYPNQEELLNKRSELTSKYRHVNKYLLSNYKSND